jgi:hypothetical protein
MWTKHLECSAIVKEAWRTKNQVGSHAFCLTKKIKAVRDKFRIWNKHSFGLIEKEIIQKKEDLRIV